MMNGPPDLVSPAPLADWPLYPLRPTPRPPFPSPPSHPPVAVVVHGPQGAGDRVEAPCTHACTTHTCALGGGAAHAHVHDCAWRAWPQRAWCSHTPGWGDALQKDCPPMSSVCGCLVHSSVASPLEQAAVTVAQHAQQHAVTHTCMVSQHVHMRVRVCTCVPSSPHLCTGSRGGCWP